MKVVSSQRMSSLRVQSRLRRQHAVHLHDGQLDLGRQLLEGCCIRVGSSEDHHVRGSERRKQPRASELAQTPADEIPLDDRLLVQRDDQTDAGVRQKGSECPNLEVLGSDSLPCSANILQLPSARDPVSAREGRRGLRRRRTCLAA